MQWAEAALYGFCAINLIVDSAVNGSVWRVAVWAVLGAAAVSNILREIRRTRRKRRERLASVANVLNRWHVQRERNDGGP